MQKQKLINFINKYSLGGLVNGVRWSHADEKMTVDMVGENRSVRGKIEFENFKFDDGVICIYNSDELVKTLSAFDDEMEISVLLHRNKPVSLQMSDSAVDCKFMLADESVVPDVNGTHPIKGNINEPNIKFNLDKESIQRFVRSKNALNEAKIFAVSTENNEIEIVINYSESNTNRFTLKFEGEVNEQLPEPVLFNADIVTSIFNCHKDFETASFEIIGDKLLVLRFKGDQWSTLYLNPAIQIN